MGKPLARNARGREPGKEDSSPPLSAAEKAAVERAEADIRAGRVHDHESVAAWLRRRAAAIVKRRRKSARSR
jgi:hypothetical protein